MELTGDNTKDIILQGKHSGNDAGLPSDKHGIQPIRNIPNTTCEGLQRPHKGRKEIRILGGIGNMWGRQYHNQDRVYDKHGIGGAINASGNNRLVIKAWRS